MLKVRGAEVIEPEPGAFQCEGGILQLQEPWKQHPSILLLSKVHMEKARSMAGFFCEVKGSLVFIFDLALF